SNAIASMARTAGMSASVIRLMRRADASLAVTTRWYVRRANSARARIAPERLAAHHQRMVRALVFAHGELDDPEEALALARSADVVVAADGGATLAMSCGVTPDYIVGDLDSLDDETRGALGS